MKKLLILLASIALLLPSIAMASIATSWNATSTDPGYISPNPVNGNNPYIKVLSTATSTFSGGINLLTGCVQYNGGTCIGGAGTNYFTLTGNNLQNNTGNALGINTAPTIAALEVQATSTTGNAFTAWGTTGSNLFSIPNNGNVGIGTSSPFAKLSISDNTANPQLNAFVISSSTASATSSLFKVDNVGNTTAAGILDLSQSSISPTGHGLYNGNNDWRFNVNGSQVMDIAGGPFVSFGGATGGRNTGEVLTVAASQTGTNGPMSETIWNDTTAGSSVSASLYLSTSHTSNNNQGSLTVNGSTNTSGNGANSFTINGGDGILALQTKGTDALNINSSQFVGIGTTSPGSALSIQGNIFLAGNLIATSTATSSFASDINLPSGHCYQVAGTCIGSSGGSGTVTSIIAGTGLSGGTITTSGTIAVNTTQNISTLSNLTVAGFVQTTSGGLLSSAALTSGQVTTALGFTPISGNQTITLSGIVTGSGTTAITTSFGTFTSATLAAALSDETGTGAAVFAGSPALTGTATGANLTLSGNEILSPLATPAGSFLAVNASGQIIATSTPSGSNSAFSPAANYATTVALPSNTYVNGTAGVGATITEVGTGALSVDGASPTVGQTVLVKNESSASHNGLYDVTAAGSGIAAFVLTRDPAYNSNTEIIPGIITYVISGATNDDDFWAMTSAAPITVGTTALNYTEVSGGGSSVTSVAQTVPSFLSISGSPITTSGTLAIGYSGTALPTANGGTGLTSIGDGAVLFGGPGGGTANLTALATSTSGNFLQLSAATGRPVWSTTLGLANGGTNATSFTTSGNVDYFNGTSLATAPLTSAVTIPYASSTATSAVTASSTNQFTGTLNIPSLGTPAGSFLAVNPQGKVIATSSPSGGGITTIANGGTGTSTTGTLGTLYGSDGTNIEFVATSSLGVFTGRQSYQSAGSFTFNVPAGVKQVLVRGWGPGGGPGGGSAGNAPTCGGGGGGYFEGWFPVTPGGTVSITIGAAGIGGILNTGGSAGGTTSFGSAASANSGSGGSGTISNSISNCAVGGTASGGDVDFTGGQGTPRVSSSASGFSADLPGLGGAPAMGSGIGSAPSCGVGGNGVTTGTAAGQSVGAGCMTIDW